MGFKMDIWDYISFATIFVLVVAGVALVVFLMGLPETNLHHPQAPGCRSIAPARKLRSLDAVHLAGICASQLNQSPQKSEPRKKAA